MNFIVFYVIFPQILLSMICKQSRYGYFKIAYAIIKSLIWYGNDHIQNCQVSMNLVPVISVFRANLQLHESQKENYIKIEG